MLKFFHSNLDHPHPALQELSPTDSAAPPPEELVPAPSHGAPGFPILPLSLRASVHPLSHGDAVSRLFLAGNTLYRGILPAAADEVSAIVRSSWFDRLTAAGRIQQTEICTGPIAPELQDLLGRFPLVLAHPRLPHLTYPAEWSWRMWWDVAHFVLALRAELRSHGAHLVDFHPYNFAFSRGRPLLLDVGCIRTAPAAAGDPGHFGRIFKRHYLVPLTLASKGHGRIVRAQLQCGTVGALRSLALRASHAARVSEASISYLRRSLSRGTIERLKRIRTTVDSAKNPAGVERRLGAMLDRLNLDPPATAWQRYQKESDRAESQTRKLHILGEALELVQPATVCDLGCNTGTFAIRAAEAGAQVAAIDDDLPCIDELRDKVSSRSLPISPAVMDLLFPSPALGLAPHATLPATDRFRSDLVLAFAVVHHVVRRGKRDLTAALLGLTQFSSAYLLVEIPQTGDPTLIRWEEGLQKGFTPEVIAHALPQVGEIVRSWPATPTRTVYLLRTR